MSSVTNRSRYSCWNGWWVVLNLLEWYTNYNLMLTRSLGQTNNFLQRHYKQSYSKQASYIIEIQSLVFDSRDIAWFCGYAHWTYIHEQSLVLTNNQLSATFSKDSFPTFSKQYHNNGAEAEYIISDALLYASCHVHQSNFATFFCRFGLKAVFVPNLELVTEKSKTKSNINEFILHGASFVYLIKTTVFLKTFLEYADKPYILYLQCQLMCKKELAKYGTDINQWVSDAKLKRSRFWNKFWKLDANKEKLFNFLATLAGTFMGLSRPRNPS